MTFKLTTLLDPDLDLSQLQIAIMNKTTFQCGCVQLDTDQRAGKICLLCSNTRWLFPCPSCDGAGLIVFLGAEHLTKPAPCTQCGGRGAVPHAVSYEL
jgi:hypothetical protein